MKISVGVCTHNGDKFIKEQLESIVNQTVKPNEIILSDDNSNDNTVKIAEQILKQSGIDYKILPYESHQGILKNFQNCLDKCSGNIIFSCDQDDVWMNDKIESFLPYFKDGCNFVYSNAVVVDSNKNLLEDNFWNCYGIDFKSISSEQFQKMVLSNLFIAGCNMAFTKELYNKIRPIPYHYLHDGWIASCAPLFGKIGFLDKPLIQYRRHGNNTSQFATDKKTNKITELKNASNDKKRFISNAYRKTFPDVWFGNQHNYVCDKIFYERMNKHMKEDYSELVLKSISFYENLLKCLPGHRFKSIFILLKEFVGGNYKIFRGNGKQFMRDVIFLLFNENKNFMHDQNKW